MKKLITILIILGVILFGTIGIIYLMLTLDPIGVNETDIKKDCELAIIAAQYSSATINQKEELQSIISFIENNLDSVLDNRKSININLLGLKDTTQRKINPKFYNLYGELERNNLESIKLSSNKTIELTSFAVVKPTDSYNYEIKHSIVKGNIPKQKLRDTKAATLIKHKLIDQKHEIYYVIKVVPRFGW